VIIIDPLSDFCETPRQLTETLFKLEELAERANAVFIVTLPADCRTDAQGRLKVKSRWATDAARCTWCIIADPTTRGGGCLWPGARTSAKSRTGWPSG